MNSNKSTRGNPQIIMRWLKTTIFLLYKKVKNYHQEKSDIKLIKLKQTIEIIFILCRSGGGTKEILLLS